MALTRNDSTDLDKVLSPENEATKVEERARVRMKAKNASAKSKRNRSPSRLAPAPVSTGNNEGKY